MRESTWERNFGEADTENADAMENRQAEVNKVREFVTRDGYRDFREWLDASLKNNEVQAGSEAVMLAQVGLREGFHRVIAHLDSLEAHVRGS